MSKLSSQEEKFYMDLYYKVRPSIWNIINGVNEQEKEEIVNDILRDGLMIFLSKYGTIPLEDKANNPDGLYYRICQYLALSKFRKSSKIQTIEADENIMEDNLNIEETMIKIENAKAIYDCVNRLNERHQKLIKLRFWESLSVEKAAEIVGYTKRTAEVTISRCYEALRNCFNRKQII